MATANVVELHGKYYKQTSAGNTFFISTIAAGLAVPISSTTTPTVALWNPSNSGKNAVLIRYTAAYVSGTSVATPIGLAYIPNAGSAIGTAAPFVTFTQSVLGATLFNGTLGGGNATKMYASAAGTITITGSGTWLMTMLGESALIATTAMNPYEAKYEFDGSLILPPGAAVFVAATAATAALLAQTLWWEEVSIV